MKTITILMTILLTGCFTYNSHKPPKPCKSCEKVAEALSCLKSWEQIKDTDLTEWVCAPIIDRLGINPFQELEATLNDQT